MGNISYLLPLLKLAAAAAEGGAVQPEEMLFCLWAA